MFSLNLKIIFRNFHRHRYFHLISIISLAIAIAVFILAMLYYNTENSYDRWNKEFKHIYRINTTTKEHTIALTPGNIALISKENVAAVQSATRILTSWTGEVLVKSALKSSYSQYSIKVDSNFFDVFQYHAIYGNIELALKVPKTIILSKNFSDLMFGPNVNPIGQTLSLGDEGWYSISAVIDTKKFPSHFKFDLISRLEDDGSQEVYSNNYYTYIRIHANNSTTEVENLLNDVRKKTLTAILPMFSPQDQPIFAERIKNNKLTLQPIKEIHLTKTQVDKEFDNNGVGKNVKLMLVVATLILLITLFNYTNLSVTIFMKRAKEIGVRKVLGANGKQIYLQYLLETTITCLVSFLFAFLTIEIFLPTFNSFISTNISLIYLNEYRAIFFQLIIIFNIMVAIVSIYPSIVLNSLKLTEVLKGHFYKSQKAGWLRNLLVIFQFAVSLIFITGVWIVNKQLGYMKNKDLGYTPTKVIAIKVQDYSDQNFRRFQQQFKAIDGIQSISRTDHLPGQQLGGNIYSKNNITNPENFITVDIDYFKTMGLNIIDGRPFTQSPLDSTSSVVINEAAASKFEIQNPIGQFLKVNGKDFKIIGLIKNFNHFSPEKNYEPIIFQFLNGNPLNYILLNTDPSKRRSLLGQLQQRLSQFDPKAPLLYIPLDELTGKQLISQIRLQKIIITLSVIAAILAITGLFAVAAQSVDGRGKEIQIRKVLGASYQQIILLINGGFSRLILISNLIAIPIGYVIFKDWLNSFAFRTDIGILPFFLSAILSLCLSIIIVTMQSFKAATSNPMKTLKDE